MKRNFIYIIILLLSVTSCNDWLSIQPQSEKETPELFKKEQGFEDALSGCYVKLNSTNLYGFNLTATDLDIMAQLWQSVSFDKLNDLLPLMQFNYQAEICQSKFKNVYSELYNVIVQANSILEYMEKSGNVINSPVKREIIKGEALALRAFCHFDLLRIFGQVPTQDASIKVSLPYSENVGIEISPLLSFEDYTKKIETDLLAAEKCLADDPASTYTIASLNNILDFSNYNLDDFLTYRRFRLNSIAVKALLARFYLYVGNNEQALACAKSVIDSKDKDGKPTVDLAGDNDLNLFNNALPSETIFGVSAPGLEGNNTLAQRLYISQEYKDALFYGRDVASNNRYNSVWGTEVNKMGAGHPYLRKYDQNKDNNEQMSDAEKLSNRWFVPVLRLSEMYLIAMETSKDLAEINSLYKKYMLARNEQVTGFSSIDKVKAEIINEYRREFIGEGQVFFMYKRMNSKTIDWSYDPIEEKNYVVPVPITEINK